jgi:hypothetical protein
VSNLRLAMDRLEGAIQRIREVEHHLVGPVPK